MCLHLRKKLMEIWTLWSVNLILLLSFTTIDWQILFVSIHLFFPNDLVSVTHRPTDINETLLKIWTTRHNIKFYTLFLSFFFLFCKVIHFCSFYLILFQTTRMGINCTCPFFGTVKPFKVVAVG